MFRSQPKPDDGDPCALLMRRVPDAEECPISRTTSGRRLTRYRQLVMNGKDRPTGRVLWSPRLKIGHRMNEGPAAPLRYSAAWDTADASIADARTAVRTLLARAGHDPRHRPSQDAQLVVSELVTNALRHAPGPGAWCWKWHPTPTCCASPCETAPRARRTASTRRPPCRRPRTVPGRPAVRPPANRRPEDRQTGHRSAASAHVLPLADVRRVGGDSRGTCAAGVASGREKPRPRGVYCDRLAGGGASRVVPWSCPVDAFAGRLVTSPAGAGRELRGPAHMRPGHDDARVGADEALMVRPYALVTIRGSTMDASHQLGIRCLRQCGGRGRRCPERAGGGAGPGHGGRSARRFRCGSGRPVRAAVPVQAQDGGVVFRVAVAGVVTAVVRLRTTSRGCGGGGKQTGQVDAARLRSCMPSV